MSFTHEHGRVVFLCDARGCPAEAPTGEGRLGNAKAIARAKGWHIGPPRTPSYCPAHKP